MCASKRAPSRADRTATLARVYVPSVATNAAAANPATKDSRTIKRVGDLIAIASYVRRFSKRTAGFDSCCCSRRPNGSHNQLQVASHASGDAARPLPRLKMHSAEATCNGRDAVAYYWRRSFSSGPEYRRLASCIMKLGGGAIVGAIRATERGSVSTGAVSATDACAPPNDRRRELRDVPVLAEPSLHRRRAGFACAAPQKHKPHEKRCHRNAGARPPRVKNERLDNSDAVHAPKRYRV